MLPLLSTLSLEFLLGIPLATIDFRAHFTGRPSAHVGASRCDGDGGGHSRERALVRETALHAQGCSLKNNGRLRAERRLRLPALCQGTTLVGPYMCSRIDGLWAPWLGFPGQIPMVAKMSEMGEMSRHPQSQFAQFRYTPGVVVRPGQSSDNLPVHPLAP